MDPSVAMHAWRIEEREYQRHEQRRGRRHAYRHLTAARTALVVIDMIPFFVANSPFARGIVPNIQALADALRSRGGKVAWVLPEQTTPTPVDLEFFGTASAQLYHGAGGHGPLRDRLWPAFQAHPPDLLVEKSARSAFFPGRCPLPQLLAERGIDTVLIAGTVTNVCCESSARDAATLGYRVIMLADANAARRDQDHNATLHTIYRSFGDVRTTADVLGLIDEPSAKPS